MKSLSPYIHFLSEGCTCISQAASASLCTTTTWSEKMDNTYWDEVKCTDTKLPPSWSELVWFAGVIAPLQWEACRHRWEFLCRRPCLHPANRHYLNEELTVYNCVLMNIFVSYGCLLKAEICSKLWGDWDLKHWIRSFPITARNG